MQSKEQSSFNHLAHDLNNILTRILNSVELLKLKINNYDDVSPLLSSIENGTYMAAEIIEDVISETTQKSIRKKRINVNSLLTDLVNTVKVQTKEKITFNLKLEQNIGLVEARYSDLYRVFMNLIANAAEAINEKGVITIATSKTESHGKKSTDPKLFDAESFIQIKVVDNGTGIDQSVMPYIFDENFSTKNRKRNSGFGLPIVKKIVEEWSGSLKVASEKGKGTEFTITFPVVHYKPETKSSDQKTILVAEDEDTLRQLLAELLESYNYSVVTFPNGESVIKFLKNNSLPDLFIIDQNMPDVDGLTCIRRIKEIDKDVPIILATGSRGDEYQQGSTNNLVNKVLNKPYNFDDMLSAVRSLLIC
ncbi:MAG: response regulator [Bacteroidota bacterium]